MTFSSRYKPLFNVNILHNYFLDEGEVSFRDHMDQNNKDMRLKAFNAGSFMKVIPTIETEKKIRGHNLIFRETNAGFSIWNKVSEGNEKKPFNTLSDNEDFNFFLKPIDPLFLNYTELKNNNLDGFFYFSNRYLTNEFKPDLINLAGAGKVVDSSFILSPENVKNIFPKLHNCISTDVFGAIRIFIKGEKSVLNATNSLNEIITPPLTFEIVFDNRKTYWRYIFNQEPTSSNTESFVKENNNSKVLTTKNPLPLTRDGFVSIELDGRELPNASVRNLIPDVINNKYYSEIYIHL